MTPDLNQLTDLGMPPLSSGQGGSDIAPGVVAAGAPVSGAPVVGQLPAIALPAAQQGVTDNDALLDEEWVQKAKDIVESTKADPFTQSNELHKVKAGFLKARFDKQISVSEDQP